MSSDAPASTLYELHFEKRGGYLYAAVDGLEDSLDISISYWRAIAAECELRATRRLLVVDRLAGGPLSIPDLDRVVASMRGGVLERLRIAFHEPEVANVALMEHAELTAREFGLTMRMFGSEHEAELWLRYGQS